MINFCKHLQLNENTDAANLVSCNVMQIYSITGPCISPEADFPSAYAFFKVTTVAHIIR